MNKWILSSILFPLPRSHILDQKSLPFQNRVKDKENLAGSNYEINSNASKTKNKTNKQKNHTSKPGTSNVIYNSFLSLGYLELYMITLFVLGDLYLFFWVFFFLAFTWLTP